MTGRAPNNNPVFIDHTNAANADRLVTEPGDSTIVRSTDTYPRGVRQVVCPIFDSYSKSGPFSSWRPSIAVVPCTALVHLLRNLM